MARDKGLSSLVKSEVSRMSPREVEKFRAELVRTIPQAIKSAADAAREDKADATKAA